ncbi:MAG: TonB-dependent receptor plug domain-containing protein [Gammaproteobacteria bacterium]|nr:TonB-dependent receptor plug domain-containing protein [Gammaproteobacteria bacterium]
MQKTSLIFLLLLCNSFSAQAEEVDNNMLQSLQDDMQEYTRLATETRQNVDYMPYIISAWDSKELSNLGISTLREALSLAPGVDISIGMAGKTTPFFRGSNPYALGQSKLIIDGVMVNDTMFGAYHQYLDMPISIIQRIEIVRGPGSVLSHVNGYAGSINVITKANRDDGLQTEDEVFVAAGSNNYKSGGFVTSYQTGELKLSSDLVYQSHDQKLPGGIDRFGTTGDTPQWLENYNLAVNATYQNFSFKSRLSGKENGVSYGQSYSITEDESDYHEVEQNFFELKYKSELMKGVMTEISVGYMDVERGIRNKVIPDGAVVGGTTFTNGKYIATMFGENTTYERIEFKLSEIDNHNITFGLFFSQSDIDDNLARFSTDDLQSFTQENILLDTYRNMYSIYLDDVINLDNKNSAQLGLKYDHYNDVDDQVSPRIALVHRYDDNNIYKFMYTHSYREPSWKEQYMNISSFFKSSLNLEPEVVDAFELGYIRKFDVEKHFKANAYYLMNASQIHAQNDINTFLNSGDNDLYGVEFEYKDSLENKDQFYINYSYVDGENVTDRLTNSASHMVKAYYTHKYSDALNISGLAKFISEKGRVDTDARDMLNSYSIFDVSFIYKHKETDTTVSLSVKNIFDRTYYFAAPANTYPGDYEQEGRVVQIGLKKGF